MATHHAIAAVSLALKGLLERALPKAGFASAKVVLLRPSDLPTGIADGVSLLLYRVGIDGTQRNQPPRVAADGAGFRPSLPVDLHYLLTAWSAQADIQQSLLAWAMRVLEDTPRLSGSVINPFMAAPPAFRADESIELMCDPLPLDAWLALADRFAPAIYASMTYVVRLVQIDSDKRDPDADRGRPRGFDVIRGIES